MRGAAVVEARGDGLSKELGGAEADGTSDSGAAGGSSAGHGIAKARLANWSKQPPHSQVAGL